VFKLPWQTFLNLISVCCYDNESTILNIDTACNKLKCKMANSMRFGTSNQKEIEANMEQTPPKNTVNAKTSIWRQLTCFCNERNYKFESTTPIEKLAEILAD
jgi:hypothetical protein